MIHAMNWPFPQGFTASSNEPRCAPSKNWPLFCVVFVQKKWPVLPSKNPRKKCHVSLLLGFKSGFADDFLSGWTQLLAEKARLSEGPASEPSMEEDVKVVPWDAQVRSAG